MLALMPTAVSAQKWSYQPYARDGSPSTPGYILLSDKGDDSTLQWFSGRMDQCQVGALKAKVERTDSAITITLEPKMMGCNWLRFVLKADGTGGVFEIKDGDTWRPDRFDRKLVLQN